MTPAELPLWGGGVESALLLALLLGARHATDPDHLAAVATLTADPERGGARAAARLGLAWGLGHAAACFLLGLGVVWVGSEMPTTVRLWAEVLAAGLIVALAGRLLVRWRTGRLHCHPQRRGDVERAPPQLQRHASKRRVPRRPHAHAERIGRSPVEALGIGLVHGAGGSAVAAALVASGANDPGGALGPLTCFAAGSVVAMAGLSAVLGLALDRGPGALVLEQIAPLLGVATLGFGVWYAGIALEQLLAPT